MGISCLQSVKNCTINSPIIDTIKFGLIQFENVENGVIEDCTIQSDMMMQYMSCYIEESENIIIKNCLISSPNHIIYLVSSNYIEIHHCEITAMGLYNWFCHGLDFISSSNNIIHHCDIHNTATGIHFDDYEGKSKNNLFYSNNLYDNELNANIKPYNNYWNDTNGNGNFWSDYKEWYRQTYDKEPTSSDGEIWDDPYIINGYNQDNYPLVKKIPQTKSKDLPNKLIKLFCIFPLFQRLLNL